MMLLVLLWLWSNEDLLSLGCHEVLVIDLSIQPSELLFGLMGRIRHNSGGLGNMVHVDDTGDDGSFFLSQC